MSYNAGMQASGNYINPEQKLDKKLFFNLHIYTSDNDNTGSKMLYLAFSQNGEQSYLASRAMPGQTLKDAISEELHNNFNIQDNQWSFAHENTYSDTAKDKKGRDVERINIYVRIPYFDPTQRTIADMQMTWIEAEEEESDRNAQKSLIPSDVNSLARELAQLIYTAFNEHVDGWEEETFEVWSVEAGRFQGISRTRPKARPTSDLWWQEYGKRINDCLARINTVYEQRNQVLPDSVKLTIAKSGTFSFDLVRHDIPERMDRTTIEQGYKIRNTVWQSIGKLDDKVLAHLVNPSFMGQPEWPDLRRSFKVIHLDNGRTIIATDGLSDPFRTDHKFYIPEVNGFGLELYIEIEEQFEWDKAEGSWWWNTLNQMANQVIYFGGILKIIEDNGGTITTELPDVPIPEQYTNEGRAPVIVGVSSKTIPDEINGPLSPIKLISVTLLSPEELKAVASGRQSDRDYIAAKIFERNDGEPLSRLG